ncbi:MAG: 3-hydroxyacyl-CoA dehydrogenase NAD-binding domain-containing protein [Actinobacteria bacterium]|nr:3-hydroxyacyl-CoA dehydrogenase NAD-binding domain-containing protein [Actinomycetota bacterium]MCL6104581.1 3-hydroxyacyl-CoA dehydrogenase NAD-binding domain-containing protein [Actinomycetota bacterium]
MKIAILGGGGVMGHGIALAFLQKLEDCQISIVSRKEETLRRALDLIEKGPFGLEKAVEKGKLDTPTVAQLMNNTTCTCDYEKGVHNADFVFESVAENIQLKQDVLCQAEQYVRDDTVFASNTSSIMITELSGGLNKPGRLVGTHWFYPANIMPLVEVARAELCDSESIDKTVNLLSAIGKEPIIVKDSPGFFLTRFVNLFVAEAIRLVEAGIAGPSEIDKMLKKGMGWPMGVFELMDKSAALDAWYHAQEYLCETLGERYSIPPLARKAYKAGYLGDRSLKPASKGGWYDFFKIDKA